MQSEGQFGMEADLSAEKYQMFINNLHKSKKKWVRYHDVLTNDACFNVNHLKQKYNIKESTMSSEQMRPTDPSPGPPLKSSEQMTPSAASSGTKVSYGAPTIHKPCKLYA